MARVGPPDEERQRISDPSGSIDVFDDPSRWRARVAVELGLTGLELHQALGAGPAYPSALTTAVGALRCDPDSLIVDVGAGMGATSDQIRHMTGARVIAVEPSPGSLEACRTLFPDVPVIAGTADALPLPDGVAQGVVLNGVLSLIDDLDAVLGEVRRVLADDAVVAITDLFLDEGDELRAGPNVFRSVVHLARSLHAWGMTPIDVGLGSTDPRIDWASPQTALDELAMEEFADHAALRAFEQDRDHLTALMQRGVLVGGCIAARATPEGARLAAVS